MGSQYSFSKTRRRDDSLMSISPETSHSALLNMNTLIAPSERTFTTNSSSMRIINNHSKMHLSTEMIHINRMRHTKRDSVHNGIVGVYLSQKSVKIAFDFWTQNISNLNMNGALEIGCSIFFGMVSQDIRVKKIFGNAHKIESQSLKFLDMMGYLLRHLLRNDINIYSNLKSIGTLHSKSGVTFKMYDAMLNAMHETLQHYFVEYTTEVKNAMSDVFTIVSRIMMDRDVVDDLNIDYLQSLDKCLMSFDGKSALFIYLKQNGCNNIVLFYKSLERFKATSNNMEERFIIARDFVRCNIDGIYSKTKKVNVSFQTKHNILFAMQQLNDLWLKNEAIHMDTTFFNDAEREVNEFILKNYWNSFRQNIRRMQRLV